MKLQRPYNVYHDYQEWVSYQRKATKLIQLAKKLMHKIAAVQLGKYRLNKSNMGTIRLCPKTSHQVLNACLLVHIKGNVMWFYVTPRTGI